MKTKYNSVLKVRKQQLDKAELNLNRAKQRQRVNEEALQIAKSECLSLSLPKNGDMQVLRQGLEILNVARDVVKSAQEKVMLSEKEVIHYQNLYKKANLDYEKIKYLESEEFKKINMELKKAEEKFIDEIAVSRFFYGEKNDE